MHKGSTLAASLVRASETTWKTETSELDALQVRGTPERYCSEARAAGASGRIEERERLTIEMYARGLSVRNIERRFTDCSGRCMLSKLAVSRLRERLWAEYQVFAARRAAVSATNVTGTARELELRVP